MYLDLYIDMVGVEPEVTDWPTQHMLRVTPELREFLAQFEDFRLYGSRKSARTLHQMSLYKNDTFLTHDEWFALRHAVADYLVAAKSRLHADCFLVLKKESHPQLKNTQRGTIFSVGEVDRLTKKILGSNATERDSAEFKENNFFQPYDFVGKFNLKDFIP